VSTRQESIGTSPVGGDEAGAGGEEAPLADEGTVPLNVCCLCCKSNFMNYLLCCCDHDRLHALLKTSPPSFHVVGNRIMVAFFRIRVTTATATDGHGPRHPLPMAWEHQQLTRWSCDGAVNGPALVQVEGSCLFMNAVPQRANGM
jgi:hypothetical protein